MTRIRITVPRNKSLKAWNGVYDLSREGDVKFLSLFGLEDFEMMRPGDSILIEFYPEDE